MDKVKLLGPKQIGTCEGHMDMGCFYGKPSVSLQFCHMGCLCVGERDIADKPFKIIVMALAVHE